jgi:hypothetical protein
MKLKELTPIWTIGAHESMREPESRTPQMNALRRLALVGPRFFSYIEAIQKNLEGRGYRSVFFDERHSNGILARSLYRLGYYAFVGARKNRHLDGIVDKILVGKFDSVVLIGVEVCDVRFVKRLADAGVLVYLYMWDSARNKPRFLSYLNLLHGKSSFDPQDCSSFDMTYIPLFAEDDFSCAQSGVFATHDRSFDLAFCGTLHSNRARRIAQLMRFARQRNLRVGLLLYFHSRWLLLLKSLVQFSNAQFLRSISAKGFSKKEIFGLFSRSKFVFDIPHPGQVGLTARTFEALRAGTRLITFNQTAKLGLPVSLQDRVHVISAVSDLSNVDFTCPSLSALSSDQDYYLSLNRFVDQILALMK